MQQIVYRGKRTIFSSDAEQAPARAWLAAIPAVLNRVASNKGEKYVCLTSQVEYTCMTALFVREPMIRSVSATVGPSVNIATGIGGRRCSKRGSVSINFRVQDSSFRVINMHLNSNSLAYRLRDLSKILEAH